MSLLQNLHQTVVSRIFLDKCDNFAVSHSPKVKMSFVDFFFFLSAALLNYLTQNVTDSQFAVAPALIELCRLSYAGLYAKFPSQNCMRFSILDA